LKVRRAVTVGGARVGRVDRRGHATLRVGSGDTTAVVACR
jgi:hypothetical protein